MQRAGPDHGANAIRYGCLRQGLAAQVRRADSVGRIRLVGLAPISYSQRVAGQVTKACHSRQGEGDRWNAVSLSSLSMVGLSNSNFESVIAAARHMRGQNPDSMPLISDLTTFVQIGDLFVADPKSGFSIVEVKEGKKNRDVFSLASFYKQSGCEHFKHIVSETETPHTVKQFERVLRQMDRMDFASKVIGEGRATDPDTRQEIYIPEPYIPMEDWDEELNKVIDDAAEKGWALDVIDRCLCVGAYTGNMLVPSPVAFLTWLHKIADGEFIPAARLIDATYIPLALPIFAIPTTPERMLDLLFGRLHVCVGISIPGLVEACEMGGSKYATQRTSMSERWSTTWAARLSSTKGKPFCSSAMARRLCRPPVSLCARCFTTSDRCRSSMQCSTTLERRSESAALRQSGLASNVRFWPEADLRSGTPVPSLGRKAQQALA